jgi:plastocyanin
MTISRFGYLSLATLLATTSCGSNAAPVAKPVASAPTGPKAVGPAADKAASLREAADLLEKSAKALTDGNKNLAEQYFSTAEIITGPEALASLAPTFRQGAPERVITPTVKVADAAPQPKVVGGSEADDEADKVPVPPVEIGSLTGTMKIDNQAVSGAFGLVTLEPIGRKSAGRAPKKRIVEQRGREFLPHVLAVPVGSTVQFPNFDLVFHNVFSTSPTAAFDLGLYKGGDAREYTFAKEGILRLGCNLHANMSAYVAVVSAPHFVVTDDSGKFSFKHLQPGKYKLKAWNERSKNPVTMDVTIKAGSNDISVGVSGDAPAGYQPDKFGVKRG